MNWLDVILGLVLVMSVVAGFRTGFARVIIGFAAGIVAFVCSVWFYGLAGDYFMPLIHSRVACNAIGFVVVFAGIVGLGALLARAVVMLFRMTGLSFFDRLLGGAFGMVRGALLGMVMILLLLAFSPAAGAQAVARSRLAPYVTRAANVSLAIAPRELQRSFEDGYDEVRRLWGGTAKRRSQPLERDSF